MSNKGNAYALALAIYAGTDTATVDVEDLYDLSDRVYRTVDKSMFGNDEAKADLYAQLEEKLTAGTSFERAVNIIEAAMDSTQEALHGR